MPSHSASRADPGPARGAERATQRNGPGIEAILRLQRRAGNGAVAGELERWRVQRDDDPTAVAPGPDLAPFHATAMARQRPDWNDSWRRGRQRDPEQANGQLPFTTTGWDGVEIARRMGQLNVAVQNTDRISCVEASFLAELVQLGPGAVRRSIEGYLTRYRDEIAARPPAAVFHRLERATSLLVDVVRRIDEQTMTYADLALLQSNMFSVHGEVRTESTSVAEEGRMAAAERFTEIPIGLLRQTRADVAMMAQQLQPGEFLSCGIDATSQSGAVRDTHAVHIGRAADGSLFFFDPAPRRGAQRISLDPDLSQISEYFVGQWHGRTVQRIFDVIARFTPPPPTPPPTPAT